MPERSRLARKVCPFRGFHVLLLTAVLAAAAGCTDSAQARLARRILEDHRARAKVKPLAAAQVIRIRLKSVSGDASGSQTIEWDDENYRETVTSAGLTTVRGIQSGKAYFTDEDGVTRVGSEPMLSELASHFYFWKREYLFDDLGGARVTLGPADATTLSVQIKPRGGEPLLLRFRQRDLALLFAESKHLKLAFSNPTRYRDSSYRTSPVEAEISWTGLPTGPLPDATNGGWSTSWSGGPAEAPFARSGRALTLPARISGQPATIALDAAEDGPLRVRATLADRLGLTFIRDVFGRTVARGARFEIGDLSFPSLAVERIDSLEEGIDAGAGAALFREAVVEIDPDGGLVRFHDPTRWVSGAGFFRTLLDDDGNRPVAIIRRKGESFRLLGPTAAAGPICLTAEILARSGLSGAVEISGLHWGAILPPLPAILCDGQEREFGEDGRLGWDLAVRFHAFFDMPHRWVYLKPRS